MVFLIATGASLGSERADIAMAAEGSPLATEMLFNSAILFR